MNVLFFSKKTKKTPNNNDFIFLIRNNFILNFLLSTSSSSSRNRNSDIIIPSIIKFLFYLSKQKDKKLITIPKIINVTDTLLANGGNIRGSTDALLELAHEFFFHENATTTTNVGNDGADTKTNVAEDSATKINRMETNTQKEVAFSMLLKFLDESKVKTKKN